MKTLYVIGNGFDLAHGIKSRYVDFLAWLSQNPQDYNDITQLYSDNYEIWSNIENNLAYVDPFGFSNIDEKIGYGGIDLIFQRMQLDLGKWSRDINETVIDTFPAPFTNEDLFFDFNYTTSLESLYQIDSSRIIKIHGQDKSFINISNLALVEFGHGHDARRRSKEEIGGKFYSDYCKYYHDTEKPYKKIIQNKALELLKIKIEGPSFENVVFLGFSFGNSDIGYISLMLSYCTNIKRCLFYCHTEQDVERAKATLNILKKTLTPDLLSRIQTIKGEPEWMNTALRK
jgi:hypothetical protein